MRIGIFGGTFSPVHNGHVAAAKSFMEQMWLDLLFVIPTGDSPHKEMSNGASSYDRLRMCEAAFAGVEGVVVSDMEIRREGKSYTVDTLRQLYDPENRLFLLCGTDMMLSLDKWYQADEIFKLCYPVYMRRENDEFITNLIIKKNAEYKEKYGRIATRITGDAVIVSSSEVREKILKGEDISALVPAAVEKYIKEKGLYL